MCSEYGVAFDLSPVAMWIEDFSGVHTQLQLWREEGVTDLRSWLFADVSRASQSAEKIKVLQVNEATLKLFAARDLGHLVSNLYQVFRNDMLRTHVEELCQLWDGRLSFESTAINYTLDGRKLTVQLKARVFPGHENTLDRVLVVTEDVSARETAREAERLSRLDAEGLFHDSPVSLWIEDFSRIKTLLSELRGSGISDLRVFTDVNPGFVQQCMQSIRVLQVNSATLELFTALNGQDLISRLDEVFRGDMQPHFREQLIDLWNGNLHHNREVVNYALDGSERVVIMHFSVMPGHEKSWDKVMIALTDISARKKAEAYLSWLGKHDVLTGVNNRAHFLEKLNLYMRQGIRPLSVVMVDLDGLKSVNDNFGHDAGDALLRRAGEVLREAVQGSKCEPARLGGDEFSILMPYASLADADALACKLDRIVSINNTFYSARPLVLSSGVATLEHGDTHEDMMRRADAAMYLRKKENKLSISSAAIPSINIHGLLGKTSK